MCIPCSFKVKVLLGRYDFSGSRVTKVKNKARNRRSDFNLDENKVWKKIFRILMSLIIYLRISDVL